MNYRCNVPFNLRLTDTIVTQGGSTELCNIFNRLGAAGSIDTYTKMVDIFVSRRENDGTETKLEKEALNIFSINNIDILQSAAQVYHSVQDRSCHGTSIQCVQPRPTSHQNKDTRKLGWIASVEPSAKRSCTTSCGQITIGNANSDTHTHSIFPVTDKSNEELSQMSPMMGSHLSQQKHSIH